MAPLGMRSGSPFTTDTISWIASFRPWCWIPTRTGDKVLKTNEFMGILSEYGWFWLASLACFICYGYIVIRWWRRADGDSELIKQAVVMVWYPIGVRFSILLMWDRTRNSPIRMMGPCSVLYRDLPTICYSPAPVATRFQREVLATPRLDNFYKCTVRFVRLGKCSPLGRHRSSIWLQRLQLAHIVGRRGGP